MKNIITSIIFTIVLAFSFSSCKKEPLDFPQNNLVVEDSMIIVNSGVEWTIDTLFDKFYPNNWNVQDYNGARLTIVEECCFGSKKDYCIRTMYYNFKRTEISWLLYPYEWFMDTFEVNFYTEHPEELIYWENEHFGGPKEKYIKEFDDYVIITEDTKAHTIIMSYEDLEEIQEILRSIDVS